ncbi:MAG: hypothetical protein A3F11_05245 [Gammaproteobacteria bacterium RIFCSPHIGHO2_12_FULL_37_14]|nr:MAG: hypothetical protein A3F11_05245 [Gammaproteobacteria bacterium RIFCSPHIGHO2_12_FULL_37_14]
MNNFLYQKYYEVKDKDGNNLLMIAAKNRNINSLQFLLENYGERLDPTNAAGETAISLLFANSNHKFLYCFQKELNSILTFLPERITIEDSQKILEFLHRAGEPLLSGFLTRVCDAIGDVSQLIEKSIFNHNLIIPFVVNNDFTIVNELIKRSPKSITFQRKGDAYTALHFALLMNPEELREKHKIANRNIIKLLIEMGANLDLANTDGISCRDLIKQHADPEISSMVSRFAHRAL